MNTFNQVYIMFVWGVKYRLGLISPQWSKQLYAVLGNLAKEVNCKPLAIGGHKDHVHVLLSLGADAPSCKDITRHLKANSSRWINENRLCMGRFAWQEGSGRFSYNHKVLSAVIKYIENQEEHHRHMTFKEEFIKFLESFGMKYDEIMLPRAQG